MHAVAQLPPPVPKPEPKLPFSLFDQLPEDLATRLPHQARQGRARLGRGGRLIFDRSRPFSYEPLAVADDEDEEPKPLHEMPNPYANWSNTGSEKVKLKIVTPNAPAREATPAQDGGGR